MSTTKRIARLSVPLMFSNLAQALHGVADTWFAARIGTDALAAVGLAGVIFLSVSVFYRGTMGYALIPLSRAHGKRNDSEIRSCLAEALNVLCWLSASILVLPFLLSWLMQFSVPNDSTSICELGTVYMQIRCIELPFMMFSTVVWSFLVAQGEARLPMQLAWATVVTNVVLDWGLVLGNLGMPPLGVPGAAIATTLATILNAAVSGVILWRKQYRDACPSANLCLVSTQRVAQFLRHGLPIGITEFAELASFAVFVALVAQLGEDVLAANQIATQYISVTFALSLAIATSAATLTAQNLGKGDVREARATVRSALLLSCTCLATCLIACLAFAKPLIQCFTSDPGVALIAQQVIMLVAIYQVVDSVALVLGHSLNAAGDTVFTMSTRLILGWGLMMPIAGLLVACSHIRITELWSCAILYVIGVAAVYCQRFRKL